MTDGPCREMTLDEWVTTLPEPHGARDELSRLRTRLSEVEREFKEAQTRSMGWWCAFHDDALAEAFKERNEARAQLAEMEREVGMLQSEAKLDGLNVKRLRAQVETLTEVAKHAAAHLQDHLDDYAQGLVENWGPELEKEIGWGEDCNSYKLGRALKEAGVKP